MKTAHHVVGGTKVISRAATSASVAVIIVVVAATVVVIGPRRHNLYYCAVFINVRHCTKHIPKRIHPREVPLNALFEHSAKDFVPECFLLPSPGTTNRGENLVALVGMIFVHEAPASLDVVVVAWFCHR